MIGDLRHIRRLFRQAIYRASDTRGIPAIVGRSDEVTVFYTDTGGTTYQNRMWVRFTDSIPPMMETVVYRGTVPPIPGLKVKIFDIDGQPTAQLITHGLEWDIYTNNGASIPGQSHQHYLLGPNPDYVEGLRFMPGVVHPSSPPALTVYVEPVFYRYLSPLPDAWEGGNSGSLLSYVPVVDDGRIHFVIIALDRSTNTIAIIDGDDVPLGGTVITPEPADVTYEDILAIAIDEKYMPLAVVELGYGQTTVKLKDITYDYRLWGGEVTAEPAGNVAMLFTQTADKTVANTVTPTDLFSTGVGSVTLPAGLLQPGMVIRVTMSGHLSTTGGPTMDIALNLGGTEVCSTTAKTLATGATAVNWRVWADIVCRSTGATGTVMASGIYRNGPDNHWGMVKETATTVNTTIALALTLTAEWGTADAGNTKTSQMATIERLAIAGL